MRRSAVLRICLIGVAIALTACAPQARRAIVPTLRGAPSDERPPWLRDLPQPIERYPAPQGWGGDNLAMRRPGPAATSADATVNQT